MAIQAITILLGVALFGTVVTPYLAAGVGATIFVSTLYTWLSLSGAFKVAGGSGAPLV